MRGAGQGETGLFGLYIFLVVLEHVSKVHIISILLRILVHLSSTFYSKSRMRTYKDSCLFANALNVEAVVE